MKVLIADDHWMIRSSLKQAIEKLNASLEIIDVASFEEASDYLKAHPDIDLMFVDLVMPGLSEFEGLRSLRANYPDIPIAVVSVHEDREHVVHAIAEGVIAYIPKSAGGAEFINALTLVLNGGVYFPREILQGGRLHSPLPVNLGRSKPAPQPRERNLPILTTREDQVLELAKRGMSNASIAERLGLSASTVRVHIHNLGLKINLKDRSKFKSAKRLVSQPRGVKVDDEQ